MDDLRIPIGSFFMILGVMLLIAYFVITSGPPLASLDVNLWCGIGALIFGAFMLLLARRKR